MKCKKTSDNDDKIKQGGESIVKVYTLKRNFNHFITLNTVFFNNVFL